MNEAIDTVSAENGSANGLVPDDNHEEGVGSPQQASASNARDGSPGGLSPSIRKGYGLKKWRRIKRDSLVKEGAVAIDSSKALKRGLTGPVNPPNPAGLSPIEARQSSEGSVGSVNMVNRLGPVPGSAFVVGQAFSASVELDSSTEDRNSKIERASNGGGRISLGSLSQRAQQGKNGIDTIKKARGEQVEAEKENPSCSLDSDLRSTDFVFSSGAFSLDGAGERLVNEYSKEGQKFGPEDQNGHRKENGEREEDGVLRDRLSQLQNDLLVDSIRSLAAVQEALEKEVENFREMGRDSIALNQEVDDELGSSDQPGKEEGPRGNSSEPEALILEQRVNQLESKLEEAKVKLEEKDGKIRELEKSKMETELEGIFQRRMEAEIEHLLLARCVEEPKRTRDLREDPEHKPGRKACKSALFSFTQLVLLLCLLRFFITQLFPVSQIVIPT